MNDKTSKGLSVISVICIIYLGLSNHSLKKKINTYESLYADTYRQINHNSLLLEDLMYQVPPEVERISRKVAKEEGIKLFKQFSDNFNKLSEEGKQ